MKPIKFPEVNVTYGEGQEEYEPLPAFKYPVGEVVTCWELSPEEIEKVRETNCIWFSQQTFNMPLQPVFATVNKSDVLIEDEDGEQS